MSEREITLVLKGKPEATIVAPSDGPLAYAANELQRYVQQMSGAELPITSKEREVDAVTAEPVSIILPSTPVLPDMMGTLYAWKGAKYWATRPRPEAASTDRSIDLLDNGVNMDFLYAPRPRGGAQHGPLTSNHPVSRKYRRNLQAWLDYLKRQNYQGTRTVFEYYYDLVLLGNLAAGRAFLIPKQDVMQEDMRYYHQQGFNGFFDCSPPSSAWFPDPLSR
jgi:hypothetical protein